MSSRVAVLLACCLSASLLASGCGGSTGAEPEASTTSTSGELAPVSTPVLKDGTFTVAIPFDPGSLDFATNIGIATQLPPFAYDALVATVDGKKLVPNLATKWTLGSRSLTFTIRPGVTCSDGSPVDAETIAKSFAFYTTPKAQYKVFGDVTDWSVSGDNAAGTVTFAFKGPVGFPVELLADVPVVCGKGLEDRSILKNGTSGSGPYVLTRSVPNDRYVFTRRDGYAWGPDGATTNEAGLPKTVELHVVESSSTAVNLLLSGGLDAAGLPQSAGERINGRARILRAPKDMGQIVFNNAKDRVTGDVAVRQALTMALDRKGLAAVAKGTLATDLFPPYTNPCASPANGASIPAFDTAAAAQLLDRAGWKKGADGIRAKDGKRAALVTFTDKDFAPEWTAAAQLAAKAWRDLGFEVKSRVLAGNASLQVVLSGDFDVAPFAALGGYIPSQLTGLIVGPPPPKGSNIPRIENPAYAEHVKKALAQPSTKAACVEWNAAEASLYEQANLIPVVSGDRLFAGGSKVDFDVSTYGFVPTSVRMHEG
jgi:peptide/nickel transport system substrate-binding protein